jgi:hypothetical protein
MVSAVGILCFLLLFWNRFLGLRSGDGGFTSGVYFLKGILPYRDYYCPVPPLFLAHCAAVLAVFGQLPIMLRGFGVFERVVLGLLLYGWLVRLFRARDAALAALVTVVVSAGDFADPVSSYNHAAILVAVATGLASSYALDEGRSRRALGALGSLVGILSLLSFATKQTIGLGVTVAVPVVVGLCLMRLGSVQKAIGFLAGFVAGWLVAAGVLLMWMGHFGILRAFLTQAFVTGPAAKAPHGGDFVARTFMVLEEYWWAAVSGLVVLCISWGALRRSEQAEKTDSYSASLRGILWVLLLGLGSIGVAAVVTPDILGFPPELPAKPTIYASLIGSGLLILYYLWRFLSGKLSRRQSQFALFATFAFIVAFMTSLSFPMFEAMTIPGLGLLLAVLLNDFEGWRRWGVYAACGVLLFCQTQAKLDMPFAFDGWLEPPVKAATMRSSLPELRGFLLSPNIVDFVDSTIRIIQKDSTPTDRIFIYPELGFFYGATGRMSATFSASHNIDTVPDSFAKEEAERLLRVRPAVLIYSPQPELLQRRDEEVWRKGKPSGQRAIIAAVETLAREYTLVRTFRVDMSGLPVYVYVRPDKVGSQER